MDDKPQREALERGLLEASDVLLCLVNGGAPRGTDQNREEKGGKSELKDGVVEVDGGGGRREEGEEGGGGGGEVDAKEGGRGVDQGDGGK